MFLLGDTLIRIKNAKLAFKEEAEVSFSNLVVSLVEVLKEIGFIKDFKIYKIGAFKKIKVYLDEGNLDMVNVNIVSKPGRRVYMTSAQIKKRKRSIGNYLISTSKGVVTDKKAIKLNQGGEVLCRVW